MLQRLAVVAVAEHPRLLAALDQSETHNGRPAINVKTTSYFWM